MHFILLREVIVLKFSYLPETIVYLPFRFVSKTQTFSKENKVSKLFATKKDGKLFLEKKKRDGRWKTFLKKKKMEDGKLFWKKKLTDGKPKTKMSEGKVFDRWGEKKKKNCKRE